MKFEKSRDHLITPQFHFAVSFNSWREKYSSKEARGLLSFLLQRFSDGKQRGWWWLLRVYTAGPNCKKPPKIKFEKFMKLTDHTCACNNLTSFECESQAPGNGSYVNFQILPWKNSWKHLGRNYVLADFWHLEPLCGSGRQQSCCSKERLRWSQLLCPFFCYHQTVKTR